MPIVAVARVCARPAQQSIARATQRRREGGGGGEAGVGAERHDNEIRQARESMSNVRSISAQNTPKVFKGRLV